MKSNNLPIFDWINLWLLFLQVIFFCNHASHFDLQTTIVMQTEAEAYLASIFRSIILYLITVETCRIWAYSPCGTFN